MKQAASTFQAGSGKLACHLQPYESIGYLFFVRFLTHVLDHLLLCLLQYDLERQRIGLGEAHCPSIGSAAMRVSNSNLMIILLVWEAAVTEPAPLMSDNDIGDIGALGDCHAHYCMTAARLWCAVLP